MGRPKFRNQRMPSTIGEIAGRADAFASTNRVDRQAVECPTCKAPVGQPCVTPAGKSAAHDSRRVMALRGGHRITPTDRSAEREERLRYPATCPECGARTSTITYLAARRETSIVDAFEQVRRIGRHKPGGGRAYSLRGRAPALICKGYGAVPKDETTSRDLVEGD